MNFNSDIFWNSLISVISGFSDSSHFRKASIIASNRYQFKLFYEIAQVVSSINLADILNGFSISHLYNHQNMSVNAWALIRGYCFKCQSSLGQQLMRCECGASCLNTAPDKVMQAMLLRPNFHVTNKHDMCANILIGNHLIYKQG